MEGEGAPTGIQRRIRWRERVFGMVAPVLPTPSVAPSGAPILLYHHLAEAGTRPCDSFAVPVDCFEGQMRWLVERYQVVTVAELVARLDGDGGRKLVAVTFDDGYQSVVTRALPILRALAIPATLFLGTGNLNRPPPALRDDDVRRLRDGGFEIGSHTVTHPDLRRLDDAALGRELVASRAHLEDLTGAAVTGFAYPYGFHDPRVVRAVRDAGYRYACTTRQHRFNLPTSDRYRLTRQEINPLDGTTRFERKLAGRYAPLYGVWDRLLYGPEEA
jgi:peptidoglycan/xylan/chitin deacetylase (PgdA/CDA1 family)